ncbi:DUF2752 domain-containing protein [Rhodococcus spelaei]|uniref:DUF2752 domain-containing protein n=1 Tax=Rhodococcus spelaei TaxID=2546320 RepID=A0A541BRU7_9NOCA|nr:DUF2752 domain-containing protein [Rhodococcus spelaei]TQF74999.1 DUF2752 domain-containing protein [Rhodococcus spelaei]
MTLQRSEIRDRRLWGPAGVAATGIAAAAVLNLRDPHRLGAYGFCPFHAVTGLWCPGCGGLRALNDLTHGDVFASLSSNLFVAPLVVVLAVAWVAWVLRRWRGVDDRMIVLSRAATVAVLVALALFTIARNTPWGSALAPT